MSSAPDESSNPTQNADDKNYQSALGEYERAVELDPGAARTDESPKSAAVDDAGGEPAPD